MIDYHILANSQTFYEGLGFIPIESPWTVSPAISAITKPESASDYIVQNTHTKKIKTFVASGEQSLLSLINKGHMPQSGRFQTITPCMRNEDFDDTHTKYFMKNELMAYGNYASLDGVFQLTCQALSFFSETLESRGIVNYHLTSKKIDDTQYDIELNDVEIGSYGYRECYFTKWVYGTGVAEPRFSRELRRMTDGLPRSNNR